MAESLYNYNRVILVTLLTAKVSQSGTLRCLLVELRHISNQTLQVERLLVQVQAYEGDQRRMFPDTYAELGRVRNTKWNGSRVNCSDRGSIAGNCVKNESFGRAVNEQAFPKGHMHCFVKDLHIQSFSPSILLIDYPLLELPSGIRNNISLVTRRSFG